MQIKISNNETLRMFLCKLLLSNSLSLNSEEFDESLNNCWEFDGVSEAQTYSEIFRNCPQMVRCNQDVMNMCKGKISTRYQVSVLIL